MYNIDEIIDYVYLLPKINIAFDEEKGKQTFEYDESQICASKLTLHDCDSIWREHA